MFMETSKNNSEELHPYVIPLPTNTSKRVQYVTTLFFSPITIKILRLFEWDKEICQKEIITLLSQHSNKTVISSIKKLVSLNLLEEREKIEIRGNRRVRVKCYKLTDIGKWYNILFKDISELNSKTAREAIANLSVMFTAKILLFLDHLKVNLTDFINQVMSNALRRVIKSKKYSKYDLVVFGSLALDVYLKPDIKINPGGSGANIATLASSLGLKTCFVSRVPADIIGSYLVADLISRGVDVSLVELEQGVELPVCVILEPLEPVQMKCKIPVDQKSLPVVQEVRDDVIQACSNARSLYLGEGVSKVYLEILSRINSGNKIVVLRPHILTLEQYFEEFLSILQYSPILVLNEEKEQVLKHRGLEIPKDLFKAGAEKVIITKGSKGAVLYVKNKDPITYSAPLVNAVNTIGAGDVFSATLIYYLLRDFNIEEAVKKAVYLSALSTTQLSSRKYITKLEVN